MRQAGMAVIAAVAVGLIAAGCGGGGGSALSKAEFIAKADATCAKHSVILRAIKQPNTNPTSASISEADLKAWKDPLKQVSAAYHDDVNDLRGVTPPADFQSKWTGALDAVDEAANELADAGDAAGNADRAKFNAKAAEFQAHLKTADAVAKDYGLTKCGQA
jgi:hypothetical protein